MDKSFFYALIVGVVFVGILVLPIYLGLDFHYDMNRRKFAFSVVLFRIIPIFGGYISTYKGGFAVHLSEKRAKILSYSKLNSERKRFSFLRSFRLVAFDLTTETGAEYLALGVLLHAFSRVYFFAKGGKRSGIENSAWLSDGDVLRISCRIVVRFTIYMLACDFIKFLKEKLLVSCRRKIEKSLA